MIEGIKIGFPFPSLFYILGILMSPIRLKRNATRSKKRLLGEVVVLVLVVEVAVQDSVVAVDGLLILAFVGHLILALVGQ